MLRTDETPPQPTDDRADLTSDDAALLIVEDDPHYARILADLARDVGLKARRPYEFGVKARVAATLNRSKGGQFIAQVKTLPGNPLRWSLEIVLPEIETQIGANLARIAADRGYRGHNALPGHKFKVSISGQRRRLTEAIKRDLRRRSAVEPVIGHTKGEHRRGPQLPQRSARRRRQRRARRRRLQLSNLWRAIAAAMLADALDAARCPRLAKPELHIPAPPCRRQRRLLHGRQSSGIPNWRA
jgi:hypothetical protein